MESQRNADRSGLSVCPSLSINQHATTYRKIGKKKKQKTITKTKTNRKHSPPLIYREKKMKKKKKKAWEVFLFFFSFLSSVMDEVGKMQRFSSFAGKPVGRF
nr:hypothetical protein Iba_chr14aCG26780 [Ipomoea batatas]